MLDGHEPPGARNHPSALREHGASWTRKRALRATVHSLCGSAGFALLTYVAVLARRYHTAGWALMGALALYVWAFWWFVVRRF